MATSQVNPSIILNTTPPQNQLQTIEGLSALKNQQYDNQLKLQQSADVAQQAQQRQLNLQDQQTVQKAMADPAINAKVHTGDFSYLEGKIQPTTLDTIRQSQTAYQKNLQELTEEQNTIRQDALKQVNTAITGLKTLPDTDSINKVLPGTVHYLQAAGVLKNAGIDPNNVPQAISDPSQLDIFQAHIGGALAAHEQALTDKKTQAETEASASTATKNKADAALAQQKAEIQKQWADKFTANPAAGSQIIDQIVGNDPAAAGFKAALTATPSVEAGQEIIKAATSHMAQRQEQLDPAITAAQANLAGRKAMAEVPAHIATVNATAPIEVAKAVATAKALRQGDNPALAGVAPAAMTDVQNKAIKLDQDYLKAKSVDDTINHVLTLAENGNKAAGANVPLLGVGAANAVNGVKRMNSAEIAQYGSAGSLLDKIQGKLGSWTTGKPIPNDVLEDMRQLHQVLGGQARDHYISSMDALNHRTNAAYIPIGTVKMKAPDGSIKVVPEEQVDHYKQLGAVPIN